MLYILKGWKLVFKSCAVLGAQRILGDSHLPSQKVDEKDILGGYHPQVYIKVQCYSSVTVTMKLHYGMARAPAIYLAIYSSVPF